MTKTIYRKMLNLSPMSIILFIFMVSTATQSTAQQLAEVEGEIFSKRSTQGSNISMTNTDNSGSSELLMYSSGSSMTISHNGFTHPFEPSVSHFRCSGDLIFGSYSEDFMRILANGNVGIGTSIPENKLTSEVKTGEDMKTAVSGLNKSESAGQINGIKGTSMGAGLGDAVGVHGEALGTAGAQFGVMGTSSGAEDLSRVGVFGSVDGTGATEPQYGVYGLISGASAATRYAVHGFSAGTGTGTQYAGYFQGDVTVTGTFSNPSDAKFKRNVQKIDSQLAKIRSLNPVSYEMKTDEFSQMKFGTGTQVGFIAQEVETIFPELVTENIQAKSPAPIKAATNNTNKRSPGTLSVPAEVRYKGINTIGMIPILTKGMQELMELIEYQNEEILSLKQKLDKQAEEVTALRLKFDAMSQEVR